MLSEAMMNVNAAAEQCIYEFHRDKNTQTIVSLRQTMVSQMNFHDSLEFIYVISGSAEVTINNKKYTLTKGMFAALSSFVPHDFNGPESQSWLVLISRTQLHTAGINLSHKTFEKCVAYDIDNTILRCIEQLSAIIKKDSISALTDEKEYTELITAATSLLVRMASVICGITEYPSGNDMIFGTIEYINDNYKKTIKVSDIARRMLCSQSTLSRQFRSTFGISITEYINSLRVTESRRLLTSDPTLTLMAVAELSGFGSLRTFHREYLKKFGYTPSMERDISK